MLLIGAGTSHAQDTTPPYNLLIGPVSIRASASVTASVNDNINIAQSHRLMDLILGPSVSVQGTWKASDLNILTFNLGVGYQLYTIHSQYSGLTITPDSRVSYVLMVGVVKLTLSNNISYQQDPVLVGQLSNSARFPTLTNDTQIAASWDVSSDINLSLTYDHVISIVTGGSSNILSNQSGGNVANQSEENLSNQSSGLSFQSDAIAPAVTYKFSDALRASLNTSITNTRYDGNTHNDSTAFRAGPSAFAQISTFLAVNASAGYVYTTYASGGSNDDSENEMSTFEASLGVTHQINSAFTQSITVGRDTLPGLTSNFTQRTYANYNITWNASESFRASANASVEKLEDSQALLSQDSNRFQAGLDLDYTLTTHANLSLTYQYTLKDSSISDLSYYQDILTLGLSYQF